MPKFQLFTQWVADMFAGPGPDPFSDLNAPAPMPAQGGLQGTLTVQSATLTPIVPKYLWSVPQVVESSKSALKRHAKSRSSLISPMHCLKIPLPGDGWYVAFNAVLPGIYCGLWVHHRPHKFDTTLMHTPGTHLREQGQNREDSNVRSMRNPQIISFITTRLMVWLLGPVWRSRSSFINYLLVYIFQLKFISCYRDRHSHFPWSRKIPALLR